MAEFNWVEPHIHQTYERKDGQIVRVVGNCGNRLKCKNVLGWEATGDAFLLEPEEFTAHCVVYDVLRSIQTEQKFCAVPLGSYKSIKKLMPLLLKDTQYIQCEILKKHIGHNMKNYVVVALRDERAAPNKKSATRGYAKRRLANDSNSRCCFCERKLDSTNATTEHIIPFSECHNNSAANFTLSCYNCNKERKTTDFYQFMAYKRKKFLKNAYPGLTVKRYKVPV
jgi:5-methylcytosine-specific restriction endonuclease McrA